MARQTHDTPAASLIIIGPSTDDLEARLAEPVGKVVLVEPDPARAASIEVRYGDRSGLSVIAAAVSDKAGQAELSEFNYPGLRSLHAPTAALLALMPGLRVKARRMVQVITPAALLDEAGDVPDPAHLRINAPGCEYAILQGLQQAGALERFDRVWVRCGAEPMFEEAQDSETVQHWMRSQGFSLAEVDETDPDWPGLHFRADPVGRDLLAARRDLSALEMRLAEKSAELEKKSELLTAREAALKEAQDKAEAQAAQIAELEKRAATQAKAADEAQARQAAAGGTAGADKRRA